jgi:hypothetical protein
VPIRDVPERIGEEGGLHVGLAHFHELVLEERRVRLEQCRSVADQEYDEHDNPRQSRRIAPAGEHGSVTFMGHALKERADSNAIGLPLTRVVTNRADERRTVPNVR